MRANIRRCHFIKVFNENKHIFLLQQKMENEKEQNVKLGLENRNQRFETEEDELESVKSRLDLNHQIQK